MNLVVVGLGLQVGDGLLPVGRQDVPILAMEPLADLRQLSVSALALVTKWFGRLRLPMLEKKFLHRSLRRELRRLDQC